MTTYMYPFCLTTVGDVSIVVNIRCNGNRLPPATTQTCINEVHCFVLLSLRTSFWPLCALRQPARGDGLGEGSPPGLLDGRMRSQHSWVQTGPIAGQLLGAPYLSPAGFLFIDRRRHPFQEFIFSI